MTAPPRSRTPWVVGIVLVLVLAIGVIVIVSIRSSGSGSSGTHSVAALKSFAARVPLPDGATLTDETANEAHGDANAYLERDYRLASADQPSAQIKAALSRGSCRVVDLRSGQDAPVDSTVWSSQTTTTTGDVNVLPPGTKGGGVELNWQGAQLVLRVSGGNVEDAG